MRSLSIILALFVVFDSGANEPLDGAFRTGLRLRSGGNANEKLRGEPLLVHAARAGNFELCRVLLNHGADPRARDAAGETLVEIVPDTGPQTLPLRFLLRTAAFVKEHARKLPAASPARPGLVIVFEPTVDYTHPEIAPHYYKNEAEASGKEGVDDDRDGFIDNVYGWSTVTRRPHLLNTAQLHGWAAYKERIKHLTELYNRLQRGELTEESPAIEKLQSTFKNPVAAMFGESGGYSDRDFLNAIVDVSHGSHVAGILLDSSAKKATIHTLSWENFGHLDEVEHDYPPARGRDYKKWLADFRADALPKMVARGRRASDYLRATQCGVVNGSFGLNLRAFVGAANRIASEFARSNTQFPSSALSEIAFELYAYETIPFVIAVAENPQILFVASAGNDGEDIDLTLGSPAYLSRFFQNVITVAASDANGEVADFSNFGLKAVNIAAPGANIESLAVAGARLVLSGTSMAAPAVAGFAARLRVEEPSLKPSDIRKLVELTARQSDDWTGKISSAGMLDRSALFAFRRKDAPAIQNTLWNLVALEPNDVPELWAFGLDSARSARLGESADPAMLLAWAAALDTAGYSREALPQIDRAISLKKNSPPLLHAKAVILSRLDDHAAVLKTLADFDAAPGNRAYLPDMLAMGLKAARALGASSQANSISKRLAAGENSSGGARKGQLAPGDNKLPNGEYVDRFFVSGRAGDQISVDLRSDDFDAYLGLVSPSRSTWESDDATLDTTDAEIEIRLPESGRYELLVTSATAGESGAYTLEITGATLEGAADFVARHRKPSSL